MTYDERACRICVKLNKYRNCYDTIGDGGSVCLSKDKAMIVLLDDILKKLK